MTGHSAYAMAACGLPLDLCHKEIFMPFTAGNDINLLQSTDIRTIGAGAGDDTYIPERRPFDAQSADHYFG